MKKINATATAIFLRLIDGLEPGRARQFNNAPGAYMAVSVDCLAQRPHPVVPGCTIGLYAVAHRYKSNGDLVADPDVEFLVFKYPSGDTEVYPTSIDHGLGYRRYVICDENHLPQREHRKLQTDLATFCGTWMSNIRSQQGIKP